MPFSTSYRWAVSTISSARCQGSVVEKSSMCERPKTHSGPPLRRRIRCPEFSDKQALAPSMQATQSQSSSREHTSAGEAPRRETRRAMIAVSPAGSGLVRSAGAAGPPPLAPAAAAAAPSAEAAEGAADDAPRAEPLDPPAAQPSDASGSSHNQDVESFRLAVMASTWL